MIYCPYLVCIVCINVLCSVTACLNAGVPVGCVIKKAHGHNVRGKLLQGEKAEAE